MKYAVLAFALVLSACGADGPPVAPDRAKPGIDLSGEVTIGVQTEL